MATSADFFQPSGTTNLAIGGQRKKASPGITEQLRALEQEFVDGKLTLSLFCFFSILLGISSAYFRDTGEV